MWSRAKRYRIQRLERLLRCGEAMGLCVCVCALLGSYVRCGAGVHLFAVEGDVKGGEGGILGADADSCYVMYDSRFRTREI